MKLLKRLFKRKLKSFVIDDNHRVTEAFELNGITYYQFDDAFKIPTGRAMRALIVYEEFNMRCTEEYLTKHVRAMEILMNNPKEIKVGEIALLNKNLKERLTMVPFPDYIYKLASVIYFDKNEPLMSYDTAYNQKKIESWKAAGGVLDFFLSKPLQTLIPSLRLQGDNLLMYSQVSEEVNQLHLQDLQDILSKKG